MNKPITEMYEELPQIAKILIQIFLGSVIGGLYRVLRYLETKNTTTLVVGVISLFTGGVFGTSCGSALPIPRSMVAAAFCFISSVTWA